MKKNLLSVLILVLLIVNIVLSAVMMISVISTNSKTADLVTSIATVLQIDLYSPGGISMAEVSMADTETYILDGGSRMMFPLKLSVTTNADGTTKIGNQDYIMFQMSLLMDSKHDDYKQYGENLDNYKTSIKDAVNIVVSSYTKDECRADFEGLRSAILKEIQKLFNSTFIYKITISDVQYSS